MSMIHGFKLPQLLRKGSPGSEVCKDVPRFSKIDEHKIHQSILFSRKTILIRQDFTDT